MQNLQCNWLLRVHYNTTVSWKTNVTKFSVVFTHKSLYNAGNKSVKIKYKKQTEKKEKRAKQNDKIQKPFTTVFAEYKFDWTTRQNLTARKHKKPWKSARKVQKLNYIYQESTLIVIQTETRLHIIGETRKIHSIFSANRNITSRRKDQIVRLSCQKYYATCSKTAGNYFSYQSYPF